MLLIWLQRSAVSPVWRQASKRLNCVWRTAWLSRWFGRLSLPGALAWLHPPARRISCAIPLTYAFLSSLSADQSWEHLESWPARAGQELVATFDVHGVSQ